MLFILPSKEVLIFPFTFFLLKRRKSLVYLLNYKNDLSTLKETDL